MFLFKHTKIILLRMQRKMLGMHKQWVANRFFATWDEAK